MENKHNFKIKFDKQENSISADTYVQSLVSLSTIIREVNYQIGTGPGVKVNVVAEQPGSFDVVLQIAEAIQDNYEIVMASAGTLAGIVGTAVGILQLKKMSKESDLTKTEIHGDQVNIKDVSGNVIFQTNNITYNLYTTNQAVNDAVSGQFQSINKDDEIEAVTITNNDDVTRFEKSDFSTLAEKRIIEIEDKDEVTVSAQLKISKVVLDNSNRKWEFVYNGSKISGRIDDQDFWDKILAGDVSFANGDALVADLKIIREYDPVLDTYMNVDYIVSNIRQHLPRTNHTQTTLEDQ